jgi:gas vesicle protein GvpL/GvpF
VTVYVYALAIGVRGSPAVRGMRGERLRRVPFGAFDAIVSTGPASARPTTINLLRYDRTLNRLWRENSALLPARFGTVVGSESELRSIVEMRWDTLRRRLMAVRNRAQMTVHLMVEKGAQRQVRPRHGASGTEYLRAAQRAMDAPEASVLRSAVRRWIRAERLERRGDIVTVHHLVPRTAVDRYRLALERAAAETGRRVLVFGPKPPYAFADQ